MLGEAARPAAPQPPLGAGASSDGPVGTQTPCTHWSTVVASPSSQRAPSLPGTFAQVPSGDTHESTVQGLPSSQFFGVPLAQVPRAVQVSASVQPSSSEQ
jgi:hypothetical protein